MKPPKSTGGKAAASFAILGTGAALGAVGGYAYMPDGKIGSQPAKLLGAITGGMAGTAIAALTSLALAEFVDSDWSEIEHVTGLYGAAGVTIAFTYGLISELGIARQLETTSPAAQLPAGSSPTYTANENDSGRSLVMAAGETVSVALPAPGGAEWSWSGTPGLVAIAGNVTSSDVQTTTFTATAGTGQIQATAPGGGGQFVLNITVS